MVNQDDIDNARKELAEKHGVDEKYLDYIGVTCGVALTFNITDETHKKYKSTIGCRWQGEKHA